MTDHLGSTEGLADASGAIASSTRYDSFGNATSNIQTSYRYTGREYDADTGLYYYRNRWYDPEVGLFISEDPIGFAGGDVNLYRYVWNNPQNFVDPYGEGPFLALLLRLFSAGASAGAYVMMNPSYVNAPAPCKPVIRASDEVSVGGILGAAAGMAGGPILGKVAGAVLRGAAGAISKGLGAAGRAIQKAAKSVTKSRTPATTGKGAAQTSGGSAGESTSLVTKYPASAAIPGTTQRVFLRPGQVIDRYGSLSGKWFSKPGVSYGARSIPPGQSPYMKFRVLKPFEVNKSLASPGLFSGQTGFGVQVQSPVRADILIKRGIIEPF